MLRTLNMLALLAMFAAVFVLYAIKYDTRKLEKQVAQQARLIERFETDIQVLRAERALLASPQRIEKLARRQGMRPIEPKQIRGEGDLPSTWERRER